MLYPDIVIFYLEMNGPDQLPSSPAEKTTDHLEWHAGIPFDWLSSCYKTVCWDCDKVLWSTLCIPIRYGGLNNYLQVRRISCCALHWLLYEVVLNAAVELIYQILNVLHGCSINCQLQSTEHLPLDRQMPVLWQSQHTALVRVISLVGIMQMYSHSDLV